MNVLRELESRIENTVGKEQREWVKKYEEYLSAEIKLDVIRKSNDDNPICYIESDNGEIKFELLGIEMPRFLGNTPNGVRLTKLTRAFRPRWIPIV